MKSLGHKPRTGLIGISLIVASSIAKLTLASPSAFLERILQTRGGAISRSMPSSSTTNTTSTSSLDPIGGGAINEKQRNLGRSTGPAESTTTNIRGAVGFDPVHHRSHLFHALEGLDRYPNYMSRWNRNDMDRFEDALQQQLRKVQTQRDDIVQRRKGVDGMVERLLDESKEQLESLLEPPTTWEEIFTKVLDPDTSRAIMKSRQFKSKASRPSVQDVLSGNIQVDLDPAQLEQLMEEEMYDVYSLPLLSQNFCAKLREYIRNLSVLGETDEFAHLQVGRRPVDLDTVHVGWINDLLFHLIVRPLSRRLFLESECAGGDLDWRQGYVAGYSVSPASQTSTPRQRLVAHTDDSEVTLNVCLGDKFDGGHLNFRGLRGADEAGHLIDTFEPELGRALLHSGRHLHEVTPVESGDRYAFIIWARSWSGVRASTCPCCWLNRRRQDDCICGSKWN
jgi:hypothetical protein